MVVVPELRETTFGGGLGLGEVDDEVRRVVGKSLGTAASIGELRSSGAPWLLRELRRALWCGFSAARINKGKGLRDALGY